MDEKEQLEGELSTELHLARRIEPADLSIAATAGSGVGITLVCLVLHVEGIRLEHEVYTSPQAKVLPDGKIGGDVAGANDIADGSISRRKHGSYVVGACVKVADLSCRAGRMC